MNTTNIEKTSGHWLLAKIGKKVLRPGGKRLTLKMLNELHINSHDKVAEFAPGLGYTTEKTLSEKPANFIGIDADEEVINFLKNKFVHTKAQFKNANAANTHLASKSQTKVYGEAMLSMHADHRKTEIIKEANRILQPQGLYAIHELALAPDNISNDIKNNIQKELAEAIKVNARPLTLDEWKMLLKNEGFSIISTEIAPMHLLKPTRIINDEGIGGFLKIVRNIILKPAIRRRILLMKNTFQKYEQNLCAVMIVAKKN